MKKIKYILWVFSFVLLWISFTNWKADILPVKNIFPDWHTMMYVSSLSNEDYVASSSCPAWTSNFWYSVLTDFTQDWQATLWNSQWAYNTSLFSYISNNVNSYTNTSMLCNNWISSINFWDWSVLFWNCWNNYIWLWKWYLDIDNYTPLNRSNVSFLKLVYLTWTFSNFNMNNLDNSSNSSFDERYAIWKHYSMYNNSYIMDLPNWATRYWIQDLNWFWYSYIYLDTTWDFISWSDLHFATVSNSALNQRISQIWAKSFETLVGWQIVIPQFLELKDLESNNIFFFSKISWDYSSLAYQHFTCSNWASDSIGDVMYWNNCISSSFWIIPNALPFTDATTPVSKSSLTWFLSYLLSDYPININFNVNQQTVYFYSLGVPSLCENTYAIRTYLQYYSFGQFFQSYSSWQSLQMYYVTHYSQTLPPLPSDSGSSWSVAINSWLLNSCLNDLTFWELNSYLCSQLLSNLWNPVQIPWTSWQYISVFVDEDWNLTYRITTQEDLAEQMSWFIWVENEDWTWSTVCLSGDCLWTVLTQPIIHTWSFVLTTWDVLDMMTNLTGWVGRCPFPYTDFHLWNNLKILQYLRDFWINFDPFVLINCVVAWFSDGRHTITNKAWLSFLTSPLISWDTDQHRALYNFLDFILILWILWIVAFLKKIF